MLITKYRLNVEKDDVEIIYNNVGWRTYAYISLFSYHLSESF